MKSVSAAEFKKKSGAYQDMALSEPITITKHDRPTLVLLSFAEYQKLVGSNSNMRNIPDMSDLPSVSIEALKMSRRVA